jgi:hypothetical protein
MGIQVSSIGWVCVDTDVSNRIKAIETLDITPRGFGIRRLVTLKESSPWPKVRDQAL